MKFSPFLIFCSLFFMSCGSNEPLPTVDKVDLKRYSGKWFEIARLPQSFEKNCACVTAEYVLETDEPVQVINSCYDTLAQKSKVTEGKAFPVDGTENSELKVQFFWPFKGGYYIMSLDADYQYALVGNPSREYLWILSRTPQLDQEIIDNLKSIAVKNGYDLSSLIMTQQSCEN
jgi:apolipoprotein D and lipocalin family protein